jgi:hypothetical protein
MHLGGRKHIIVLDHAAIHITYAKRKCPGHLARRRASRFCPGMTLCSLIVGAK